MIPKREDTSILEKINSEIFGLEHHAEQIIQNIRVYLSYPKLFTSPLVLNLVGATGTGKTKLIRLVTDNLGLKDHTYFINMANQSDRRFSRKMESIVDSLGYQMLEDSDDDVILEELFDELEDHDSFSYEAEFFGGSDDSQTGERNQKYKRERKKKRKERAKFCVLCFDDLHNKRTLDDRGSELMREDSNDFFALMDEGIKYYTGKHLPTIIFTTMNLDLSEDESVNNWEGTLEESNQVQVPLQLIQQGLAKRFRPEVVARFRSNFFFFSPLDRSTGYKLINREFSRIESVLKKCLKLESVEFDTSVADLLISGFDVKGQGGRGIEGFIDSKLKSDIGRWLLEVSNHGYEPEQISQIKIRAEEKNLLVKVLMNTGACLELQPFCVIPPPLRKKSLDPSDRAILAVHEGGHCLVNYILSGQPPKALVIGLNDGQQKGLMRRLPSLKDFTTKRELYQSILVSLAGAEAEKIVFGEDAESAGSTSDIKMATLLTQEIVLRLGMGRLPMYRVESQDFFSSKAIQMNNLDREEVESILLEARSECRDILNQHKNSLLKLANALYEKLELTPAEVLDTLKDVPSIGNTLDYARLLDVSKN